MKRGEFASDHAAHGQAAQIDRLAAGQFKHLGCVIGKACALAKIRHGDFKVVMEAFDLRRKQALVAHVSRKEYQFLPAAHRPHFLRLPRILPD